MTRQITIKLNEEKFGPMLDDLKKYGHEIIETNSAIAGFAVWFLHRHCFVKRPELGMLTGTEFLMKSYDKPKEQIMFETIKEFKDFSSKDQP
ncbi:TPA: hypothetical protein HA265_00620 [Candidatus Woesearchaeota archaeon]|nr:hypothetical protein [Candidatus Woesearchaeota archaeon]